MNRKNYIITLAIGCLLVLLASGAVFAAEKMKGGGLLTSIADDGTVIIRDVKGHSNGYLLSPSVTVQDLQGRQIWLRDIFLPHYVYFEYEYARGGFMITLIRETAA